MEDDFAVLYQKLIGRLEPDPARLRRGWQQIAKHISGADPPGSGSKPLHSSPKYDIQGIKDTPSIETRESGENEHE